VYGLRYIKDGRTITLVQIGGGGRLRLQSGGKRWWSKRLPGVVWEVYETKDDSGFATRDLAEDVARNIAK
jgi:hypothetical protein